MQVQLSSEKIRSVFKGKACSVCDVYGAKYLEVLEKVKFYPTLPGMVWLAWRLRLLINRQIILHPLTVIIQWVLDATTFDYLSLNL